jgi:hypothetical protein
VVTPEQYEAFIDRKRVELAAAQRYVEGKVQEGGAPETPIP